MTRIAGQHTLLPRKVNPVRNLHRRTIRRWITLQETKPDTSVIVPVLNEADNILPLVQRLSRITAGGNLEVLFVDDSQDGRTVEAVLQAQKKYGCDRFKVGVYHRKPSQRLGGLSSAVTDGMARAKSNRVIVMDGDLQHPPETIAKIVAASAHCDVVIASRYCSGGNARGLNGLLRHIVSRGSTVLTKLFFPRRLHRVSDPMTGFFMLNRQTIDPARLHPRGFKILLEILATHPKLKVTEVPLQFAQRHAGESHGTIKQGVKFLTQLLDLRFRTLFRFKRVSPKFIQFGLIGGSVFAVGMILLYLLVEVFNWSPLAANAVQLALTFWLNYQLNRRFTWRERAPSSMAAQKFLVSRASTTVLNYLIFAWLISLQYTIAVSGQTLSLSVNYLLANVITLFAAMIINYSVSDRWVFADSNPAAYKPKSVRRRNLSTGAYMAVLAVAAISFALSINPGLTISILVAAFSLALLVQASIEVWRTAYTYRQPESVDRLRFPAPEGAKERFCIIVPARHESAVLADTLYQLTEQTHPSVRIIAVVCSDDVDTLLVARAVERSKSNVKVAVYPLAPDAKPSKPKQLNHVFNQIKDEKFSIIGVIDAEDTVHPGLLMHVDAAFRDLKVGIVQGGVQLMNHASSWYSLHNVLEYYRWFNSSMAFQSDHDFMPLGGNTVFVRRTLLKRAGGWPETLTEDCALGVLLSSRYWTKTAVYYEPSLATREETPESLTALFKQRVRWNQGFFHEWRKGVWRGLPTSRQRLLAEYVLLSPILLAGITLLIPASIITAIFLDAPVGLVLLTYLPLVPASLLVGLNAVFLYDFGQAFKREVRLRHYAVLVVSQIPYQVVLNAAAFWAVVRELRGDSTWYKTAHSGQHRTELAYAGAIGGHLNVAEEPLNA